MINEGANTYFASPDRVDFETILEQNALVKDNVDLTLFRLFPDIAMILNDHRQIVAFNEALAAVVGGISEREILGARPGELFHCVNATDAPGGCGTAAECKECGAILAVLDSARGKGQQGSCKLLVSVKGGLSAFELSVKAASLPVAGHLFTLVFMKDIGSEMRRNSLEKLFLHDIVNVVFGLVGVTELLSDELPSGFEEYTDIMKERVELLVHEIESYKRLVLAENGELGLRIERVLLIPFLDKVAMFFRGAVFAEGKTVTISTDALDKYAEIYTDKGLLLRIVLNLLKNAFEASSVGDLVLIQVADHEDGIKLTVCNNQYMNAHVRSQVFHRSFSTKGKDRGLGTYSAKLFTENHLCGHLIFTSDKGTGTTFILTVPDMEEMLEP